LFPGAGARSLDGRVIDLSAWFRLSFPDGVDVVELAREYGSLAEVLDAQPVGIGVSAIGVV